MPLCLWISIEPEQLAKGTEKGDTKDTGEGLPHWKNKGAHKTIDPLTDLQTDPLGQGGHASNVDRWVTSLGTARGREGRRTLISSTMKKTTRSLASLSSRSGTR